MRARLPAHACVHTCVHTYAYGRARLRAPVCARESRENFAASADVYATRRGRKSSPDWPVICAEMFIRHRENKGPRRAVEPSVRTRLYDPTFPPLGASWGILGAFPDVAYRDGRTHKRQSKLNLSFIFQACRYAKLDAAKGTS